MMDKSVAAAEAAFETYSELSPANIARFLERYRDLPAEFLPAELRQQANYK